LKEPFAPTALKRGHAPFPTCELALLHPSLGSSGFPQSLFFKSQGPAKVFQLYQTEKKHEKVVEFTLRDIPAVLINWRYIN
jgi:hypothetical protein